MKVFNPIMVLIMSAFLLSGCKQILKSIDDTLDPDDKDIQKQYIVSTITETHTYEYPEKATTGFLTNIGELTKAETELRALVQYGGKKIYVYQTALFYDDGRINIMLRHPDNLRFIDNYVYNNGRWSAPTPVQLSVNTNIENQLIPLNEVSFASVAKVAQGYNNKAAQIEGAKWVSDIYLFVFGKELRWFPNTINGSRERYSIEFNADGTLKSFKQN